MPCDPFDLQRFVEAQARDHAQALAELRSGRKRTHWIWYVLPQMRGLGSSAHARHFGITGLEEARAYLAHPLLGPRLAECVEAISAHTGVEASVILGPVDALKYQSCLTLFDLAAGGAVPVFAHALRLHFAGARDERTLELAGAGPARGGQTDGNTLRR